MPHEKLRPRFTFDADRRAALRQIAPEAFADGRVNFDALREALGEHLESDGPDAEHFGLAWPGKRDARRMAATPAQGALVPVPGAGIDEDTTRNVFIEGENLETLKLLQKAYAGRVKMIYIDPPYNTGNDFVYEDDFKEPLAEYLRRTGQTDEEGRRTSTNTRADGRFHSKWLSMMYPRLRLARNLLRDDGVIFVSIDDNEVHHLRMLMNEVFGEENFFSQVIVQSNKRGQTYKQISKTHEYLLIFTKNAEGGVKELEKEESDLVFSDEKGDFSVRELRNRNPKFGKFNRPNLFFPIFCNQKMVNEDGFHPISLERTNGFDVEILPFNSEGKESCWRWSRKLIEKNNTGILHTTEVVAKAKKSGGFNVYEKYRKSTYKIKSIWDETGMITEQGTIDLKNLGLKGAFDFPKPTELIKRCIQIGTDKDDIILDFFGGSATTAHATFMQNAEDGGERNFIVVQIPDKVNPNTESGRIASILGFNTLSEVSLERIKKAGNELAKKVKSSDLGFRVYRLAPSHYKAWEHYEGGDLTELERLFSAFESPLAEGWTPEGLLAEVMLLEGFPLDSRQEALGGYTHNRVVRVTSDFCAHALLVCLDARVHPDTIAALASGPDDVFVCLDNALSDEQKARLSDKGMLKTI